MKKHFIAAFLSMLLLGFNVYAAPPEIAVSIPDKAELVDGQYIITVTMSENPGFSAAQLELSYNREVLECQKVIPGEVLKGMLTDTNPTARGEKTSAILSAAGTENTTESGTLASFVFTKPKNGNPDFEIEVFELTSANGKKIDLNIDIQNNYGEIDESSPPTENDNSDENTSNDNTSNGGASNGNTSSGTTFKPSGGSITTHPVEKPIEKNEPKKTFTDVPTTHWASEYIEKAVEMGIVSGYENGDFRPDNEMTRAEFATVLWNVAGKPVLPEGPRFTDVSENDWFYKQVAWCYVEGIINGTSGTTFSPNDKLTREQAMTMLYRYKGSPPTENAIDKFSDSDAVSDYAKNAMNWAVSNGIVSGVTETELSPKTNATRAQLATIMVRFLNK